jgi:D-alanyl-D-alanine carboxypeptidase (penicillin-binding protein 5/6)
VVVVALVAVSQAAGAPRHSPGSQGPSLSSPSAVLVDARDGRVLYGRAPGERRPIASTTKLMTVLLSVERLPFGRRLRADRYRAGPAESLISLQPGERMSVADLLRAVMLASANDAAVTLARGVGGTIHRFVGIMNRKARALGLSETHYANPVGLDEPGNYSSARDLATLARIVLRDTFVAQTADMSRARLATGAYPRIVVNRNDLVGRVPWVDGLKTGHTLQAGYVLVGAGTRKGARLVSVVLGAPSLAVRDADTLALLRYGFTRYRRAAAMRPGRAVAEAKVAYFGDRRVSIEPVRRVSVTVRKGEHVRTRIDAPGELHGPIDKGTRVGRATVYVNGRRVRAVRLVTAAAVPHAGLARKAVYWVTRPLTLVAIAIVALFAAESRRRRIAAGNSRRRNRTDRLD